MSIDQISVVDAIGIDNTTGNVVLTISDHLKWDKEHLHLLQEKINTYLVFVESGELIDSYPDARGRKVTINVVFKYVPDNNALKFLSEIDKILNESGLSFDCEVAEYN